MKDPSYKGDKSVEVVDSEIPPSGYVSRTSFSLPQTHRLHACAVMKETADEL